MSDSPELAVKIRGLRTRFGRQVIHDGLDIDVYQGEILGVVGGSGTGKSVLMRIVLGLHRPERGEIEVLGQPLTGASRSEVESLESRWGVLFQDGALFSSLTVDENIQVPLKEHSNLSQQLLDEIAALKVAMVGLPADACHKYPAQLSGGMRKRAGLARALALDPEILFLDEPTAGLDPIGAAAFDRLIRQLHDSLGFTVFMVTHDLDSLHTICDRIAVLADHKVEAVGSMDVMLQSEHPWIREYFHGPRGRAALAG